MTRAKSENCRVNARVGSGVTHWVAMGDRTQGKRTGNSTESIVELQGTVVIVSLGNGEIQVPTVLITSVSWELGCEHRHFSVLCKLMDNEVHIFFFKSGVLVQV